MARINNNDANEANLIKILNISSKLNSEYQNYFWPFKVKLIRKLIANKDYKTAYLFTSTHGHKISNKDYIEAEWLSGWIALRFLNQPKIAISHFQNFYNNVKLPISLARGSYWLGRSYEALKSNNQSKYWYEKSANYPISFYGQLSVCKINDCKVTLPEDPRSEPNNLLDFRNNKLVKAALILQKTKYSHLIQEFLKKAIDHSENSGEIALITKLGFQFNQHHLSVETAKHASYKNIHIISSGYPMLKSIHTDHDVNKPLVMALIRQESVFNHQAVSSAGAMGLMQIMPHVAKETAVKNKIKFNKTMLVTDPKFNSLLGISHLNKLLKMYNNSYILAIAAYNAGERNVNQWIESYGDPRMMKDSDQIIDWLEKIPFYETRNYVQRVLEGRSIYHLIMNKEKHLPITKDIHSK